MQPSQALPARLVNPWSCRLSSPCRRQHRHVLPVVTDQLPICSSCNPHLGVAKPLSPPCPNQTCSPGPPTPHTITYSPKRPDCNLVSPRRTCSIQRISCFALFPAFFFFLVPCFPSLRPSKSSPRSHAPSSTSLTLSCAASNLWLFVSPHDQPEQLLTKQQTWRIDPPPPILPTLYQASQSALSLETLARSHCNSVDFLLPSPAIPSLPPRPPSRTRASPSCYNPGPLLAHDLLACSVLIGLSFPKRSPLGIFAARLFFRHGIDWPGPIVDRRVALSCRIKI